MSVPGGFAERAVKDILFNIHHDTSAILPAQGNQIRRVDIASHLHIAYREEAYYLLRQRLRVRDTPVTTRSVKGIDGRRYVESLYACDASRTLAIVEACKVSGRGTSQFSQACVIITLSDAFIHRTSLLPGRQDKLVPSPELAAFVNGSQWSEPLDYGPSEIGNMSDEDFQEIAGGFFGRPYGKPEGMDD